MLTKRRALIICGILAVIVGGCVLFFFNPETTGIYPKCPFHALTGLKCPGCGTLRGLHALMHLRFADAWRFNAAMVTSIPLIVVLLGWPKFCKKVWAASGVLVAVLAWWIARNI